MKRFLILAVATLFAFACAEKKAPVEEQVDAFNARMTEVLSIVDLDAMTKFDNINSWYESLSVEQKQNIAAKCEEFIELQKEMAEWRKSLNQEDTERVKIHMKNHFNPHEMRKVNLLQQMMRLSHTNCK